MYFTVYINFIMFSLKQEKPNDTLLPLYIFLYVLHLNLKAKGQFDMSNWLFSYIVLLQYKNIFKIFAGLFLLFMLRKIGQQHNLSFYKQSAQSINKKNDENFNSAQDHISYGRNPSCSCYKPLTESNGHLNHP